VVVGLVYVKDIISLNEILLGGRGVIGRWWLFRMMSLGGLPPFLGFFIKWSAIICLLRLSITLVLVIVFLALVSLFYYLRVVYSFLLIRHWIVRNERVEILFGMSLGLFISLGGVIFLPFLSFI
jgi:NADH:ubiquinone oxidoreductase subunit 2 (subunit N)